MAGGSNPHPRLASRRNHWPPNFLLAVNHAEFARGFVDDFRSHALRLFACIRDALADNSLQLSLTHQLPNVMREENGIGENQDCFPHWGLIFEIVEIHNGSFLTCYFLG